MMLLGFAAFAVFLILWGFAWHAQMPLAFGILIGLGVGAVLARFIGPFDNIDEIPIWLPATPLISVVIVLFVLGILAWRVPDDDDPDSDDTH
ncbi:MAG: hypothetical protein O6930_01290 [Gammaproteobacteria bacterium]|nr:hypothetical protein [Gammaproteobacteria bacterium]